jgi:hypothetical protein
MRLFPTTSLKSLMACASAHRFILAFALSIFCGVSAYSQDTSNSVMAGLNPYGYYHGGDIDSISMAGGGLNLHIPIFSDHSQRGKLNFTYSLVSSSSSWYLKDPIAQGYPYTIQATGYQTYGLAGRKPPTLVIDGTAILSFTTVRNINGNQARLWYVQESNGAVHHLGSFSSGRLGNPAYLESVDGTGFRATILNSPPYNVITRRDGIQFTNTSLSSIPTIEDPNGNQISNTTTYDPNFGGYLTTMVDTLGRAWSQANTTDFSHCPVAASKAMTWTIPGPNSGVSVYKFCFSNPDELYKRSSQHAAG